MTKNVKRVKVADYLSQQIDICGKSQKDIAAEVGYPMPNVITMFKQGKTKLPINKVPQFAKALGVDPVHFLRLAMGEYMPETWEVIDQVIGKTIVSEEEMKILETVRKVGLGISIAPSNEEEQLELAALALKWRQREEKAADAARRRVQREKKGTEGAVESLDLETNLGVLLGLDKK